MLKVFGLIHNLKDSIFGPKYEGRKSCVVVIFKRCKKTVEILNQRKLVLNGISYPIMCSTSADYNYRCGANGATTIAAELLLPPEPNSSQQMLNSLNDDCLLEILLKDNIGAKDLLNIATTCSRLQSIAIRAFRAKYSEGLDFDTTFWTLQKIEQYFEVFGASCKAVNMLWKKSQDIILKLIEQHCTELAQIRFGGPILYNPIATKSLFSKVPIIIFEQSDTHDYLTFLDSNCELEQLICSKCIVKLPAQRFEKLIHLRMENCEFDDIQLQRFRELNPQLLQVVATRFPGEPHPLGYIINMDIYEYYYRY